MELRTEFPTKPSTIGIGFKESIVTVGSCFADAIGNRLHEHKFNTLMNPLGTVYNPLSIHHQLTLAIQGASPGADGYCQRDGLFLHHDFHSSFSEENQSLLHENLKSQLKLVGEAIRRCRVLIMTYGTAWVYEQKANNQIVANCHKIPHQQFNKFLLTQKRILESWDSFYKLLKNANPSIQVILTVSPVRHVKDTLELNSVSKSTLRLTCHTITESNPSVQYFPAYEIMMDDLRDYRFYEPDLIHPSKQAEEYIWQKFGHTFFDTKTKDFLERWNKVRSALQHRPFNPSSESHQKFLQRLLLEINDLGQIVDVSLERSFLQSQLQRD